MLGKAVTNHLNEMNFKVIKLNNDTAHSWSESADSRLIHSFIVENNIVNSTIINCAGMINPKSSFKELLNANHRLPKNILEAASRNNVRFINIGTVMEDSRVFQVTNPYIESKRVFLEEVVDANQDKSFLHLQCHTLYSDLTYHPTMFLGQMIESIRTDEMFYTSAGYQIREYHHADDLAKIIVMLVTTSELGIQQINSGQSIRQKTLSRSIFSQFGKLSLLQINPLDSPAGENYDFFWPRHSFVAEDSFRKPVSGIIEMIAKQI